VGRRGRSNGVGVAGAVAAGEQVLLAAAAALQKRKVRYFQCMVFR
jgi:hypothetical protein